MIADKIHEFFRKNHFSYQILEKDFKIISQFLNLVQALLVKGEAIKNLLYMCLDLLLNFTHKPELFKHLAISNQFFQKNTKVYQNAGMTPLYCTVRSFMKNELSVMNIFDKAKELEPYQHLN